MGGLLQNMGIMKKILALMLMLGAVAIITTAVNAWTIRAIDLRYEELVNNRLPAITQMVRSNRMTAEVLKNAFRATMYAPGSAERQVAVRGIDERLADTQKSFDEAERRDPRLAPLIVRLRSSAEEIHRLSRQAVAHSNAGNGAAAVRMLAEADRLTDAFGKDLKRENDRRIAETEAEAADLGSAAHGNLLMALLITIAATAVALFIAHRVVRGSIVGPLLDLNGQMTELAAGNHAIDVSHAGRKDEVGTMSRSILVFRDRAEERARLEEQKKRADAEQELVVATLGKQLNRLADGDMDVAIGEQFPDSYRQLRQAFNSAVESLGGLIRSVSDSTGQIRTPAQKAAMEQAVGQINEGMKTLRAHHAETGRRQAQVESLAERAGERSLILERLVARNEDADMAEVASTLVQRQTALQASYTLFGRLANLSLVNFLR